MDWSELPTNISGVQPRGLNALPHLRKSNPFMGSKQIRFKYLTTLNQSCKSFGSHRSPSQFLLIRLLPSGQRNLAILSVSITGQVRQISRGKFLRLPRTTAGFTFRALDGYGLCCSLPARPTLTPQIRFLYVGSRFGSMLLSDAASRQSPLHFANPSPPSGWIRDLHP